jgi:putative ABC transport system substrate-binding protein
MGTAMNPKPFVWLLTALLTSPAHRGEAQHTQIWRIGYLASAGSTPPEPFRQARRDLGYIEGKNVSFEFRGSGGKPEHNANLALELVTLKADLIVAEGAGAIRAAKKASSEIPIMMSEVNDPITLGFVANLAQPGGNITGLSNLSPELSGKRLELLKEIIPRISRVALLAYRGVANAHEHRVNSISCSLSAFAT